MEATAGLARAISYHRDMLVYLVGVRNPQAAASANVAAGANDGRHFPTNFVSCNRADSRGRPSQNERPGVRVRGAKEPRCSLGATAKSFRTVRNAPRRSKGIRGGLADNGCSERC